MSDVLSPAWIGAALVGGYLLGSIPFGVIATRLGGAGDVRDIGSGNIGATNVLRTGNKRAAAATLLLDMAKGAIPVLVFLRWGDLAAQAAGVGAVIGHTLPVWLGFRGGKGVATAAGVMLGLAPLALGVAAATWLLVLKLSGYVSLASIAAAALFPAAVYLLERPDRPEILWLDALVAVAIIWLHRANIRRLLNGTESRFGRRAAPPARP